MLTDNSSFSGERRDAIRPYKFTETRMTSSAKPLLAYTTKG